MPNCVFSDLKSVYWQQKLKLCKLEWHFPLTMTHQVYTDVNGRCEEAWQWKLWKLFLTAEGQTNQRFLLTQGCFSLRKKINSFKGWNVLKETAQVLSCSPCSCFESRSAANEFVRKSVSLQKWAWKINGDATWLKITFNAFTLSTYIFVIHPSSLCVCLHPSICCVLFSSSRLPSTWFHPCWEVEELQPHPHLQTHSSREAGHLSHHHTVVRVIKDVLVLTRVAC